MELHLATLWEAEADRFADDEAIVHGHGADARRLTWAEYESASARFASFLHGLGVGRDTRVALYLFNSPEYLIAQFGACKVRGAPVNVNYRYLEDELAYVLDDSDAEVLVYHASLADRVERARARCPRIKAFVEVDDREVRRARATLPADGGSPVLGAISWDDLLPAHDPAPRLTRNDGDLFVFYTGGTTGLPKGVLFRMSDFVRRMLLGYQWRQWTVPTGASDVLMQCQAHRAAGERVVSLPACPLMHATGGWLGAQYAHLMAGSVVLLTGRRFDADELWRTAEAEQVDTVTIVGDAFARPMLRALDDAEAAGHPYRLERLRYVQSSGVILSAEVQEGLLRHLDVRLTNSLGSTEAAMARAVSTRNEPVRTARFEMLPTSKLIADDGTEVKRGSRQEGRLAGLCYAFGYHKDAEKTAETFVSIDGMRYVLSGDRAIFDDDGSVVLLGRGSHCINTGGEKVFPEEVEEALKLHPAVDDCLVIGVPDEKFGERVVAVLALRAGSDVHRDDIVQAARAKLAAYKLPRQVHIVAEVQRGANGKADYEWARRAFVHAESAAKAVTDPSPGR